MQRLITLLLVLFSFTAQAQYYWQESFEAPYDYNRNKFVLDTLHPNNRWQIGRPQKPIFDSAYSPDNVIVTDTVNYYPGHDTSVFTIQHMYMYTYMFSLRFYYKLDKGPDETAKIEVSGDNGLNWINPLTEDTTYMFYWGGPKPRLDTMVYDWAKFELNMETWANAYSGGPYVFPHYRTSDTVLFRFTYASGNVAVPHDGWMMDDFLVEDAISEGYVAQLRRDDLISIYPNPSKGTLSFKRTKAANEKAEIVIYNTWGQEVYRVDDLIDDKHIELPLANGVYILRYATANEYAIKRLVINR